MESTLPQGLQYAKTDILTRQTKLKFMPTSPQKSKSQSTFRINRRR